MNYIQILYGINSKILKISISNCLHFINNLKESKENNNFDYIESDIDNYNIFEKNLDIKDREINKNKKISKKITINNQENNNNIKNTLLIRIIPILLLLLLYLYFIFNLIHLLNICKKSDTMYIFSSFFQEYQNQLIDMFNIYREFLYDNQTKILNSTSLEYLRKLEDKIYDSITENNQITDEFIGKLIASNLELSSQINKNYCSFYIVDYFETFEECIDKFKVFINYDFYYFSNYFLEEIKIGKYMARHKFENEIIKGDLNNLNISKLINEFRSVFNQSKNIEFRLNLFNNEDIHSNLNLIFINSLLPLLQNNRKFIFEYLSLEGEVSFFIILGIIYLAFLSILFLLCSLFINKILNSQINETKNMLSIIPIGMLVYQKNNKSILDLLIDI